MENKNYAVLFKTGDAELRALLQLEKSNFKNLLPIVELTRGRKLRGLEEWPIVSRLSKLFSIFEGQQICLDITSSNQLSNNEINELYNPINGYKKWIDFLSILNSTGNFSKIVPCVLANFEDDNFILNYNEQLKQLTEMFTTIAYRNSLKDDGCYDDLTAIEPFLFRANQLLCIIDCEYITSGGWRTFAEKTIVRINNIVNILGDKVEFVICATSFPKNVADIGNDLEDSIGLNEIDLFDEVKRNILPTISLRYGDYGSINPIRNDEVIMARGWIPRIDTPTENEIFYIRERKGIFPDYSSVYNRVAKRVLVDNRFPRNLSNNWGIEQIRSCANGAAPGSNPSFWISVRMNIHICQQLYRLNKSKQ
jgi:hypothetical protein